MSGAKRVFFIALAGNYSNFRKIAHPPKSDISIGLALPKLSLNSRFTINRGLIIKVNVKYNNFLLTVLPIKYWNNPKLMYIIALVYIKNGTALNITNYDKML